VPFFVRNQKILNKSVFVLITAAVLGLFCAVNNAVWLHDSGPVQSVSFDAAAAYAFRGSGGFNSAARLSLENIFNFRYLSFYYILPVWLLRQGLTDYRYPIFFNLIYVFAAMLFLYSMAKKKYGRISAALSAVFFILYPGVYVFSRHLIRENALLAFNVISFYLLLKSKEFSRTGISIIAGVMLGIGLGFRNTITIYMAGPLLAAVTAAVSEIIAKKSPLKRMLNAALYFSAALLPAGRRYFSAEMMARNFSVLKVAAFSNPGSFSHSAGQLINFLISPPFFLFFCGAVIVMLVSKKGREEYYYLSWFFLPVMLFAFVFRQRTGPVYLLPVLPAAALISGAAIKRLINSKKGKVIILLMAGFGIVQYYSIFSCVGKDDIPGRFKDNVQFVMRPAKYNIISDVQRIVAENRQLKILFLQNHDSMRDELWVNPVNILMRTVRENSAVDYRFPIHDDYPAIARIGELLREADLVFYDGPQDIKDFLSLGDYIDAFLKEALNHALLHPHKFLDSPEDYEEIAVKKNMARLFNGKTREIIIAEFAENFKYFELMEEREYPDPGSRLFVYRKYQKR